MNLCRWIAKEINDDGEIKKKKKGAMTNFIVAVIITCIGDFNFDFEKYLYLYIYITLRLKLCKRRMSNEAVAL